MNDKLHFFGNRDTFTLIVGEGRVNLYVARPILEQIPFFNKALRNNQFREALDKEFILPDDDPQAVADLLYFVYADHVKHIEYVDGVPLSDEQRGYVKAYVRAFIVADKYSAERTANRILDRLIDYHMSCVANPQTISILSEAGLQNTNLYGFLVDEVAARIRNEVKEETGNSLNQSFATDGSELFKDVSSEDLLAIMKSLMRIKREAKYPSDKFKRNPCLLHTHQLTPKCVSDEEMEKASSGPKTESESSSNSSSNSDDEEHAIIA